MIGGPGVSGQRWVLRRRGARPAVWVAAAVAVGELVVGVATAAVPAVGVVIAVGFWLVCAGWVTALSTAALRSPRTRRVTGWLWARLLPASRGWRTRAATGWRVGWVWLRMRTGWAGRRVGGARSPRRALERSRPGKKKGSPASLYRQRRRRGVDRRRADRVEVGARCRWAFLRCPQVARRAAGGGEGWRVMARRPEKEIRALHWQVGLAGAGAIAFAVILWWLARSVTSPGSGPSLLPSLDPAGPLQAMVTALITLGLVTIGGVCWHRRWYFHPAQRLRRDLGDPEGWLDRHDYDTAAGPEALRRDGEDIEPHTRPAPGEAPPAITRHGWSPGVLVSGPRSVRDQPVYCPWSKGTGVLGPQGSGKTQLLIHAVLDAPGAALVNSTKPELAAETVALRALLGPTPVFNPLGLGQDRAADRVGGQGQGLGELENTAWWDPVAGCTDESTADRRAWGLVRGAGGAAGINRPDFWARKAAETLRYYLMAAALGGHDMTAVMHWANNPDDDPTPASILDGHPDTPAGWNSGLRAILATVKETRDGYFSTAQSAVAFMDSPRVRAACRPGPGQGMDDVAAWLRDRGTLYLIGSDDDQRLAPLFTALTEHIFFEAKRLAGACPRNRLPVPLTLLLDEVAHMNPVPLHKWVGDSRGWGITVIPVVQALSQFATTWGRDNADTIWRNLPIRLVLPGVNDSQTLEELSYLAGKRRIREVTEGTNHHGGGLGGGGFGTSMSTRLTDEPVITGPLIGALPAWYVFALGLARHPAVLRYEPGYQRVAREKAALAHHQRQGPTDDPRFGATPGPRR